MSTIRVWLMADLQPPLDIRFFATTNLEGMKMEDQIEVNGVKYIRVGNPAGGRAVIVVDRGWIFAGNVTRNGGRIILTDAVWVFRWESIGFDGVIKNPKSDKVTIRKMSSPVEIPEGSEVFSVPVVDDWGI